MGAVYHGMRADRREAHPRVAMPWTRCVVISSLLSLLAVV